MSNLEISNKKTSNVEMEVDHDDDDDVVIILAPSSAEERWYQKNKRFL
jgi:hypothetical protein